MSRLKCKISRSSDNSTRFHIYCLKTFCTIQLTDKQMDTSENIKPPLQRFQNFRCIEKYSTRKTSTSCRKTAKHVFTNCQSLLTSPLTTVLVEKASTLHSDNFIIISMDVSQVTWPVVTEVGSESFGLVTDRHHYNARLMHGLGSLLWALFYFSLSGVVSRAFSALCVYSKFGNYPHPLGYLCAKFRFFPSLRCWVRP